MGPAGFIRRFAFAVSALLAAHAAHADSMTFVMDPFPPFTFEDQGVAAGPLSDTIRAVCATLKIECKLEVYPWRRALKLAEDGQVDGIYAIAPIPEREQFFYVSTPIVESAYGVFTLASSPLKSGKVKQIVEKYGMKAASS